MAASLMRIFLSGWSSSQSGLKPNCLSASIRKIVSGLSCQTPLFQCRTISFARPSVYNSASAFPVTSIARRLPLQPQTPSIQQTRTKVKCSLKKGKEKSVKSVFERFYRLDWGAWIRPRVGRAKRLWKKTPSRKYKLKQHVFCNKTQSKLLDKMVTTFWRRRRYYVDDPYEPYHKRHNLERFFPEKRPFYP